MRRGDVVESELFELGQTGRARFQFFPKGDENCEGEGVCSLWLFTDRETIGSLQLRLGSVVRTGGASEFCKIEDVLVDGAVEVGLHLEELDEEPPVPFVQQGLHMTGLQLAEWRVNNVQRWSQTQRVVTSPPFRFHHVLLGDMYLELLFGAPHEGFCTVFFQCRVPTMQLKVRLQVGEVFEKTFVALGKRTREEDIGDASCLEVNLGAPGVLTPQGDILVRCALEEVVSLPPTLKDMIPQLDERAQWPKRLF